jgi:hypothetical protein
MKPLVSSEGNGSQGKVNIYAPVAQGIEQRTSNPLAVGSIPTRRTIKNSGLTQKRQSLCFSRGSKETLKYNKIKK